MWTHPSSRERLPGRTEVVWIIAGAAAVLIDPGGGGWEAVAGVPSPSLVLGGGGGGGSAEDEDEDEDAAAMAEWEWVCAEREDMLLHCEGFDFPLMELLRIVTLEQELSTAAPAQSAEAAAEGQVEDDEGGGEIDANSAWETAAALALLAEQVRAQLLELAPPPEPLAPPSFAPPPPTPGGPLPRPAHQMADHHHAGSMPLSARQRRRVGMARQVRSPGCCCCCCCPGAATIGKC